MVSPYPICNSNSSSRYNSSSPRTVEEIFKDYSGRRAGLVRALTHDVDDFYGFCDPDKENLCLYGHPSETWEVTLPAEEVPPELPEPALGINFARDGMNRKDWLSLVAVHSDSWLLSVAFYLGFRLNRNESWYWEQNDGATWCPRPYLLLVRAISSWETGCFGSEIALEWHEGI